MTTNNTYTGQVTAIFGTMGNILVDEATVAKILTDLEISHEEILKNRRTGQSGQDYSVVKSISFLLEGDKIIGIRKFQINPFINEGENCNIRFSTWERGYNTNVWTKTTEQLQKKSRQAKAMLNMLGVDVNSAANGIVTSVFGGVFGSQASQVPVSQTVNSADSLPEVDG